jgi:divalent metal cation (Fe/Co/Zn/Cd) transporter
MDANSYATFLIIGVLIILVDGQILYRGGLGYLRKVYADESARSVMQLVSVLFHLAVLGALALISLINVSTGMPVRDLVVKLGVVLLILAAAHGITMAIVVNIRDRRREEQLEDEIAADRPTIAGREASVHPVADDRFSA